VHFDYPDLLTDVFAGRIYEHQPSPGTVAFRKALKRVREYDSDDYSIHVFIQSGGNLAGEFRDPAH
jgi:hypothetical protein